MGLKELFAELGITCIIKQNHLPASCMLVSDEVYKQLEEIYNNERDTEGDAD